MKRLVCSTYLSVLLETGSFGYAVSGKGRDFLRSIRLTLLIFGILRASRPGQTREASRKLDKY
jgi:hypothetical protein